MRPCCAPTLDTPADGLLEGPTADFCEKGGRPMVSTALSFRKEVLDYLSTCDQLLAVLGTTSASRFSKEELEVLEYSVAELQKVLVVCKQ